MKLRSDHASRKSWTLRTYLDNELSVGMPAVSLKQLMMIRSNSVRFVLSIHIRRGTTPWLAYKQLRRMAILHGCWPDSKRRGNDEPPEAPSAPWR